MYLNGRGVGERGKQVRQLRARAQAVDAAVVRHRPDGSPSAVTPLQPSR